MRWCQREGHRYYDYMLVLTFFSPFFNLKPFDRWWRDGPKVGRVGRSASRGIKALLRYELGCAVGGGGDGGEGGEILPLHQLVARAGCLVVFYCVLRGPVYRHGPEQAATADLEEIYKVPETTVAGEEKGE